jgi:hypothetical protein
VSVIVSRVYVMSCHLYYLFSISMHVFLCSRIAALIFYSQFVQIVALSVCRVLRVKCIELHCCATESFLLFAVSLRLFRRSKFHLFKYCIGRVAMNLTEGLSATTPHHKQLAALLVQKRTRRHGATPGLPTNPRIQTRRRVCHALS